MRNLIKSISYILVLLFVLSSSFLGCDRNDNNKLSDKSLKITDMAERDVNIPSNVDKVSCIHPIPSHMVWRLAPKKLASIDNQFKDRLLFMSDDEINRLKSLPVTGTFNTGDMSTEQMLTIKPDVIISLKKDINLDKEQQDYSSPVVAVSKDSLLDYEESWRFIGKLVGNEKEGNELADYWKDTITKVTDITSKIPKKEKLKVYYAQPDINTTVGSKTIMASIIRDAGGINLSDTIPVSKSDEENENLAVSIEQILSFNPDVIIAKTAKARDEIISNQQWKNISAVKNNRVYTSRKYEMLDRIQSLIGLVWTANTLYPNEMKFDIDKETRTFYSKVYLSDDITEEQINEEIK